MKDSLQAGIEYVHKFKIQKEKTVPALYPESEEFVAMPKVFATGYMVGLIEWACIKAINPYLDWPDEQTVGIHIDVNHIAATPPGLDVTIQTKLVEVDGRRLVFEIEASDNLDLISKGRHVRFVINKAKFDSKMAEKAKRASNKSE
jgi:fluoroacetyl-CoA thioesterase